MRWLIDSPSCRQCSNRRHLVRLLRIVVVSLVYSGLPENAPGRNFFHGKWGFFEMEGGIPSADTAENFAERCRRHY
jgi:hypothetical protein